MKLRLFLPSALVVAAVVACSGADGTELFAPASNSSPTDPGQGAASDPSASSNSGGTSSSSSSSAGGAGKKDASPPPPPPPPTGTISCGPSASCTVGKQVCCLSHGWDDNDPSFECKPAGNLFPCSGASKIACDDRTDCPNGQICCGMFEDATGRGSAECRSACKGILGVRTGILCDPTAAVDECAALNKTCAPSQTLPGYFVCKD